MNTDRRKWLATLLGLLYPGLGHLYAGAARRAVLLLVAIPLLFGPFLMVGSVYLPRPLNLLALYGGVLALLAWGGVGGALAAGRAPRPYSLHRYNRWWVYAVLLLLGAYAISPLGLRFIRSAIGRAVRIPTAAMEPTVLVGDFLFITADHRPPARGEIVAFRSVEEPELLVMKRAVGVAGDTLEMRAGQLLRNGQYVSEPYAPATDRSGEVDPLAQERMKGWQLPLLVRRDPTNYQPTLWDWGPIAVPADAFFDLGDNRDASYDGRFYGVVPVRNVLGRPRTVYYSYDPESYKPLPWLLAARWHRFGIIPR